MNYLQRNRTRGSLKKPIMALVGIFALGALIFSFLDGVIIAAASPLWRGENFAAAKLSNIGDFFKSRNSLVRENNALQMKIAALELERAARFSSPYDAEDLSQLIGRRRESGGVVAAVLVSPPKAPYDTLIIDAGSSDDIEVGMRVFIPEGPILGEIVETYISSAKVKLFSAPGEKTNAVLERHGIPVTLEGAGGGNFRVVLPREAEVEVGDRILSADVFSNLMSVVGGVSMEPTDSFKDVFASSPANIFNLHLVLVRP